MRNTLKCLIGSTRRQPDNDNSNNSSCNNYSRSNSSCHIREIIVVVIAGYGISIPKHAEWNSHSHTNTRAHACAHTQSCPCRKAEATERRVEPNWARTQTSKQTIHRSNVEERATAPTCEQPEIQTTTCKVAKPRTESSELTVPEWITTVRTWKINVGSNTKLLKRSTRGAFAKCPLEAKWVTLQCHFCPKEALYKVTFVLRT